MRGWRGGGRGGARAVVRRRHLVVAWSSLCRQLVAREPSTGRFPSPVGRQLVLVPSAGRQPVRPYGRMSFEVIALMVPSRHVLMQTGNANNSTCKPRKSMKPFRLDGSVFTGLVWSWPPYALATRWLSPMRLERTKGQRKSCPRFKITSGQLVNDFVPECKS